MTDAPSPLPALTAHPRPAFHAWLILHDKDFRWAGERLGVSHEHVRLICEPFAATKRRDPSQRLVRDIIRLTNGAVRAEDWHPPVAEILSGRAA